MTATRWLSNISATIVYFNLLFTLNIIFLSVCWVNNPHGGPLMSPDGHFQPLFIITRGSSCFPLIRILINSIRNSMKKARISRLPLASSREVSCRADWLQSGPYGGAAVHKICTMQMLKTYNWGHRKLLFQFPFCEVMWTDGHYTKPYTKPGEIIFHYIPTPPHPPVMIIYISCRYPFIYIIFITFIAKKNLKKRTTDLVIYK